MGNLTEKEETRLKELLESFNHEELIEASKLVYLIAEGVYKPEELKDLDEKELAQLASNISDDEIIDIVYNFHDVKEEKERSKNETETN